MPGRTKKMGRLADKVLTLFPFEKELYDRANVPAECVGHPLGDELPGEYPAKAPALRKELDLENGQELLALLPGSRPMELKRHLEVFARAASLIRQARPGVRPVLAVTKETPREEIRARAKAAAGFEIPVFAGRTREVLAAADLAVVVSGTATLETALLGCPMIVCYRTGWLNYCLGRLLVTIPCIALANVVAGRAVAPELWQGEVNPARVAESVLALFEDQEARGRMRAALASVREKLGPRQGSRRAAEAVLAELRKGAPA
jgi:lipid-A-disaccharide synthase